MVACVGDVIKTKESNMWIINPQTIRTATTVGDIKIIMKWVT